MALLFQKVINMKTQLGLGKGLGALIPSSIQKGLTSIVSDDNGSDSGIIALVDITKVRTNRFQPRIMFDPMALAELSQSIKEHGVIQPITVRRQHDGYELISGERRIRASIEAGLDKIPAYILDITSNEAMIELALIENVQRENLNDIEIAMGYQLLIDECSLSQELIAQKVGKNRSTISNFLRLLKLPTIVQQQLAVHAITNGHARALLGLSNPEDQIRLCQEIMTYDYSVRKTEEIIKDVSLSSGTAYAKGKKNNSSISIKASPAILSIEDKLRDHFATQVKIHVTSNEQGSLHIDFYSFDDLQRLLDIIKVD
jgi:ParB family chromosome partitioning protein